MEGPRMFYCTGLTQEVHRHRRRRMNAAGPRLCKPGLSPLSPPAAGFQAHFATPAECGCPEAPGSGAHSKPIWPCRKERTARAS
jgi:hypothetical protein